MAELFTLPARATDSNNAVLPGAKLFFYATGTTTPQDVYEGSDLVTPLPNPVVADSGGKFPAMYQDPAKTYRAILKSSDGSLTVFDDDPVGSGKTAADIGYTHAVSGGVSRTVESKLREVVSVKDFGAVGDGVTNDQAAFQAAVSYGMNVGLAGGCVVYVPPGQYKIVGQVTQDRSSNSALGSVDIVGAGRRATWIMHSGATTLFSATGHPTEVSKQTTDLCVSGMTILGTNTIGSVAIGHTLCSDPHYSDLHIEGFDYAFYLQDVDQAVFDACMIQFNKRGLFARKNPVPVGNSTMPNQYSLTGTSWLNNGLYAYHCVGGSNWAVTGGAIQYNGQDGGASGFGIKFEDCGYEGGNIVMAAGVSFENNNGLADVVLVNTTASGALTHATYAFLGCSFNRTSNTILATNSILTNFASAATVGVQKVKLDGSVFKSLGAYTPSGARPYLNWSGAQSRSASNFSADGAIFEDAAEAPSFVQSLTKPFIEVAKSGTQSIANATPTVWQLDATLNGFSWNGAVNGSFQMSVPEAGNYLLTANLTFSTSLANQTLVELLKGSETMAVGVASGSSVVTASATKYLTAGELISVRVTQNSGGAATLNGSAASLSYLSIMKLVDA